MGEGIYNKVYKYSAAFLQTIAEVWNQSDYNIVLFSGWGDSYWIAYRDSLRFHCQ